MLNHFAFSSGQAFDVKLEDTRAAGSMETGSGVTCSVIFVGWIGVDIRAVVGVGRLGYNFLTFS